MNRLNTEINAILATADFKERVGEIGYETAGGTNQQFAEQITRETKRWAEIIKRSGGPGGLRKVKRHTVHT